MKDYYAQRANEHDKVYLKPERQNDIEKLHGFLENAFSDLDVLEIACGTGYWTKTISSSARSVTAIDYNDEVLEIARDRSYGTYVTFIKDDAYTLTGISGKFNAVFAGFFWSHIPLDRIEYFLKILHSKAGSGSKIIFIDNRFVEGSCTPLSGKDNDGNTYQIRKLHSGKEFEILKNFPSEDTIRSILNKYGDNITIKHLEHYWIAEYNSGILK